MSVKIRKKWLENGGVIRQRLYAFGDGLEAWCPDKACIFCRHCTDIFYDSSGPYGFACELDPNLEKGLTDKGCNGACELFEETHGEIEVE